MDLSWVGARRIQSTPVLAVEYALAAASAPVLVAPRFSEGATRGAQLDAAHPALFGSFIAVSPEWGPLDHTPDQAVREAFSGDREARRGAFPIAVMRSGRQCTGMTGVHAVGALDRGSGAVAPAMAAESACVGMRTTCTCLRALAHNWNPGAAGLEPGIRKLLPTGGIR